MYIALDLETTGFEANNDQIIEIAAILFEGSTVIATFETLVNPGIPIPPMVTHITGIKNEDLIDAPSFADVHQKFMAFIGNYPIIGHNISFDVNFLKQKGMIMNNPLYDTLVLSAILLPDLPSYSLDTLTRRLKINHKAKHRAMSDTEACYHLFLILEEKIAEINPSTREKIKNILEKSHWILKEPFLEQMKSFRISANTNSSPIAPTAAQKNTAQKTSSEIKISDFYIEKGPLATAISDYEKRETQEKMSEKILAAFEKNQHALIEAGTGTGKTLAYLLTSTLWSLQKEKVVISTYTHHLQTQIVEKDMPLLLKALQQIDPTITVKTAILKGRKNYLSLKRLELFKNKDFFEDHEVSFLIKILLWLDRSESGDLSELNIQGKEVNLLDEICCQEHVCPHDNQEYKAGCYLVAARQKAETADIVIVNHALLIQNEIAQSPLLPEYHYLVVDEAHHLEKVATDAITVTLSFNPFVRPFANLAKTFHQLIGQLGSKLSESAPNFSFPHKNIDQLVSRIEIFFGFIGIFLEKELDPFKFQYQLSLSSYHLESMEWKKIIDSATMVSALGTEIIANINEVYEKLNAGEKSPPTALQELKGFIFECERRLADLKSVVLTKVSNPGEEQASKSSDDILWILKSPEESISLKSAPFNIGEWMRNFIFQQKNSVILCSATLTTNNNFNYIRDQLGLDENFEEIILPSHFSYPDQVKILIPEDLPEPNTEGYFLSCAALIADVIRKNHGRTLALFTSKKALAGTFHEIAPQLKQEGFSVLAQNVTGGRGKILEHFKSEPENCAILGTASFWEGVDIKGNDLTCVIMQKLPFDPPDDPIIAARCKKYKDSFNDYQVPRAILRFKQGFGRLIRSSKDTGSIVILDTRVLQKSYGSKFLESLPGGIKIQYGTKENLAGLL